MKIILREDVPKLGKRGEMKEVSEGYAINYLIPKKLALEATAANIALYEREKKFLKTKDERLTKEAEELLQRIGLLALTISRQAGESNKLYGSVTNQDIADLLKNEGLELDKKKILLDEPIKSIGEYEIPIRLHSTVTANLKVSVIKG